MDAGLKQRNVISRRENGGWKRVPVSGGHRDKRVGESACSIFIQLFSNVKSFLVSAIPSGNIIFY